MMEAHSQLFILNPTTKDGPTAYFQEMTYQDSKTSRMGAGDFYPAE